MTWGKALGLTILGLSVLGLGALVVSSSDDGLPAAADPPDLDDITDTEDYEGDDDE